MRSANNRSTSQYSQKKNSNILSYDVSDGAYDTLKNPLYVPEVYNYTHKKEFLKPKPIDPVQYKMKINDNEPILTYGYGVLNEYSLTLPVKCCIP